MHISMMSKYINVKKTKKKKTTPNYVNNNNKKAFLLHIYHLSLSISANFLRNSR